MKKVLIYTFIMAMGCFVVGGILQGSFINEKETYASIIEENFEEMNTQYSNQVLMSSNPYDYIDNDNYDNIVNLGFDAVPLLREKGNDENFTSLNAYIATIAMGEITGVDLYEITGTDYETADEFYELWDETMRCLPDQIEEILGDEKFSEREKIDKLEKYGIFGEAYVYDLIDNDDQKVDINGDNVDIVVNKNMKNKIKKILHSDKKTLIKAKNYCKKYIQ